MGSRIRENVSHIFECFCEVVKPQPLAGGDSWIIQRFPEKYRDDEVLKSVPKFAYPCDFDNSVVQHYSFVLTSGDSKWTFGYCRHNPKSETALVLLSYLPWHESFYRLLDCISDLIHKSDKLYSFLTGVYQSKVPDPGNSISVPLENERNQVFSCQAPNRFQLASIPGNRNLTEYYNAVETENMIAIFASMLFERRIVVTSKKLYRLSACVQAANAVIYPMNWQHIYIPVLPQTFVDYLLAPMPYLIGVPHGLIDNVRKPDVGDVVVLDVDNNIFETPFDDLENLPSFVVKQLRGDLKNKPALLGDGVSRAFLRALVALIGGYRDALKFNQGEKITFSSEAFVESRPPHIQPFLKKMLHLQIFQQFIDERLEMLNAGLGFSDEFEIEACNYCDKSNSKLKAQYKEWTYTMKKEGSAFLKNVKTKANPAVKSAVKTVKERGKDVGKAYKGIRSKLKDLSEDKIRPKSHGGAFLSSTGYRKEIKKNMSAAPDKTQSEAPYCALSPASPDYLDPTSSGFQLTPLNVDLIGDLHDVLFKQSSSLAPPNTMKQVRSLENLKSGVDGSRSLFGTATGSDDSVFLLGSNAPGSAPPKPPSRSATTVRRTNKSSWSSDTRDLIRLDSTPSDSEGCRVDPGAAGSSSSASFEDEEPAPVLGGAHGLANPLYPYFSATSKDLDLLKEYGIDFSTLSMDTPPSPPPAPPPLANGKSTNATNHSGKASPPDSFTVQPIRPAVSSKFNWTKFE